MLDLIKFSDRLGELIFDAKSTPANLAKSINVDRTTISRYLSGKKIPAVRNIILLSDYFQCTTDYLLGIAEENLSWKFKSAPSFDKQLPCLLKQFGLTKYQLQKRTGIPESAIYNWQRGTFNPSIDNILKIAESLDCSIDYVIGRGD